MAIVYDGSTLKDYIRIAAEASADHPILIDRFLEDAFEVDVDVVSDGTRVLIAGIMQHIEEAGIHSGDSACVLPPYLIAEEHLATIRRYAQELALALEVRFSNGEWSLRMREAHNKLYILSNHLALPEDA